MSHFASMRDSGRMAPWAPALALGAFLFSRGAWATDRFEIQVYDGRANDPGVASLENHVNFTARGHREPEPPEAPTHHQAHWTFEGAVGGTRVWEPGVYLQTAFVPGDGYQYAGMKLRSKFMIPDLGRTVRLGINFEIGRIPRRFEEDQWGSEIRPIAAFDFPAVKIALNPNLGIPLAHGGYKDGPHFEPAVSVKGVLSERVALGLEYFAAFGPLGSPERLHDQEHYLYAAADTELGGGLDLSYGVGYGLGTAEPLTFKAIFAYEFGRIW